MLFGLVTILLSLVFVVLVKWIRVDESVKQRWLLVSIHRLSSVYLNMLECLGLMDFSQQGPSLSSYRGHLIIANHSSLIDALFIIAATENLCCIVKTELLGNPFTRYIVKLAGFIPNRSDTLLIDASNALASGRNLLIFPEGTRNTYDDQLAFKRGAANIALTTGCPIIPVVLSIHPRALEKGGKWYVIPEKAPRVVMTIHHPLDTLDYIDKDKPVTIQARQLNSGLIQFFRQHITGHSGYTPDPGNVTRSEKRASP